MNQNWTRAALRHSARKRERDCRVLCCTARVSDMRAAHAGVIQPLFSADSSAKILVTLWQILCFADLGIVYKRDWSYLWIMLQCEKAGV
jgi:hypothetical protein